ncbi:MAG: radical SAM protein [Dissulfurispiraceae bacterium]|jgi:MoaA/NifB/PqqE/SkfB family radical SAM enzyme|nr:radical SAM protein [Dissulfurispiraceae bacterium]
MKNYMFDGHKLMYHPLRVAEYIKNGDCNPLYMEVSPVSKCNYRCIFCAYDYLGYQDSMLETKRLKEIITELADAGVKSILYAGEGEPLLHPDMPEIVAHTKKSGIDSGIYTNGFMLNEENISQLLPNLIFLRFSFNAGTAENYSQIHKTPESTFKKVVGNIKIAVKYRNYSGADLDIGQQFVLIRENANTLFEAIKIARDSGIDYFVIKPFILQNENQSYKPEDHISAQELEELFNKAESLSTNEFKVAARKESFETYGQRRYKHCYGTSFISVLNSRGDISSCLPYWDREKFTFGNIYQNSFSEIWNGEQRAKIKCCLENTLNVAACPPNCRPHRINEFLSEIKQPAVRHINFI